MKKQISIGFWKRGSIRREGNVTFDEMIKEDQMAGPDKVWDNPDKTTGLMEGDDYSLELFQWYKKLILEFV